MSFEELTYQEVESLGSFYGLVQVAPLMNYPEVGLSWGAIEAVLGHLEVCLSCQTLKENQMLCQEPVRLVIERPTSPDDQTLETPVDQDEFLAKFMQGVEEHAAVCELAGENHSFNLIQKVEWALRWNRSTREGLETFLKHLHACITT